LATFEEDDYLRESATLQRASTVIRVQKMKSANGVRMVLVSSTEGGQIRRRWPRL